MDGKPPVNDLEPVPSLDKLLEGLLAVDQIEELGVNHEVYQANCHKYVDLN